MIFTNSYAPSEIRLVNQTQFKKSSLSLKNITLFAAILFCIISSLVTSPAVAQQSKVDSLLKVLKTVNTDTAKVTVLTKLSDEIYPKNPRIGIDRAKEALELSMNLKNKKLISSSLTFLGSLYSKKGVYDSALIYFDKSHELEKMDNQSKAYAMSCRNLGKVYEHLGKSNKAAQYYNEAIEIYKKTGDKKELASAYMGLGNTVQVTGDFANAVKNYEISLELYKGIGNEKEIGRTYLSLSYLYILLKKFDVAEKFLAEAERISGISKDEALLCNTWLSYGSLYLGLGKHELSNKYLFKAQVIAEKNQDMYLLLMAKKRIAINFACSNKREQALKYFKEVLSLAGKMANNTILAEINENLGYFYLEDRDYQHAIEYLNQSDKFAYIGKNISMLKANSRDKVEIYCAINKPDSVLRYFNRYILFSDSINRVQNSKAIAEMQTKYETEKKDKEILALYLESQKKKNTIWAVSSFSGLLLILSLSGFAFFHNRKKREHAVLLQTISETDIKALRAQMNPHFIFNCIHTIDCLLDDQKIQESKDCLIKFATLTRSVLENSNKREISLDDELMVLSSYMDLENTRLANPFVYQIEKSPGINPELTLIPPLILQPFVENAIKHGFERINRTGQIKIGIKKENDWLICTIEDNGSGRNKEKMNNMGSAFKKESMGIKLSEDRLRLLGEMKNKRSYFTIEDLIDKNNKPSGTRIKMHLPFEQSI